MPQNFGISDISADFVRRASKSLDRYGKALAEWSTAQQLQQYAVAGIDRAKAHLELAISEAYHSSEMALATATAEYERASRLANWIVLATVIISLTALSFFAYRFGRFLLGRCAS
jgi:hypothetical protein